MITTDKDALATKDHVSVIRVNTTNKVNIYKLKMGAKSQKVLQVVSGWPAVELAIQCFFVGLWQLLQFAVRRLWKGHRRKWSKNMPPVELTVDSSIGVHCYIKILGVKYHYVETGPKSGQLVLILGDAPDTDNVWVPSWSKVLKRLVETDHHVVTLDLRGTGGSEGGSRSDLSPPQAVEELAVLLNALGASESKPAIVIGFGIGGMLTWYLAHCQETLINKFVVIGAPHPNLYWQHPPALFCHKVLHFIQWPYFPERWLAESHSESEGKWSSSRARDWSGALNYVRGAAWWRVHEDHKVRPRGLLLGAREHAQQLVASAHHCTTPALRLVPTAHPGDSELQGLILDYLVGKEKPPVTQEYNPTPRAGLMGRVLGAVADKGRGLTRLALPAHAKES